MFYYHGVDKLDNIAFLYFDYGYSAKNAYLGSCETYAVCFVHGFEHVVEQSERSARYLVNGTALFAERGLVVF
jgi:hypothetical protein